MKTLHTRPRFQAATRHYHRSRPDTRGGWDEWVDLGKRPGVRRRGLWAAAMGLLLTTATVMLLFRMNLL